MPATTDHEASLYYERSMLTNALHDVKEGKLCYALIGAKLILESYAKAERPMDASMVKGLASILKACC